MSFARQRQVWGISAAQALSTVAENIQLDAGCQRVPLLEITEVAIYAAKGG
jgi:hypothetical protein